MKYVPIADPKYPNQCLIIKGLQADFSTEVYGAAFLAYLIATFNTYGFEIEAPHAIIGASKNFIKQNNVLVELIEEAFEKT